MVEVRGVREGEVVLLPLGGDVGKRNDGGDTGVAGVVITMKLTGKLREEVRSRMMFGIGSGFEWVGEL